MLPLLLVGGCSRSSNTPAPASTAQHVPAATNTASSASATASAPPPANMTSRPHLDFHEAFSGAPVRVRDEETGQLVDIHARRHTIATLVVPTGRLVVGDPLSHLAANEVLARSVAPGRYPVELLLWDDASGRPDAVLLARVVFSAGRPTRWETAALAEPSPAPKRPGARMGYPSDAATGSFVDVGVLAEYAPVVTPRRSVRNGIVYEDHGHDRRAEQNSGDLLRALQAARRAPRGSLGHAEWQGSQGNLVAFSLGGDQVVPTYWGLDAGGTPVEIVSVVALSERSFPEIRWPDD
ncbi:Hypothetical protein A7982_10759 [Minicystis rosea]|nr:Hypothetical protein A7982_10759 [Minicystis rosea]